MPGLTFYLNNSIPEHSKLKNNLNKLQKVYKVPTLNYNENYIVGDSFLVYSCVPDFISEPKILKINEYIIAIDGDFYNKDYLLQYLKEKNLNKLEIIHFLFLKEKNEFAKFLNGEFNIIIFNIKKQKLIVTNDKFARKPFFYMKLKNGIIFSSEKKGIISLSNSVNMDHLGIMQVIAFNHNVNERTFVEGIRKLKPGNNIIHRGNKIFEEKYFEWKFNTMYKSIDRNELIDEMHSRFLNSVHLRLKNKKRILLWLSGGYDSRSIGCAIPTNRRSSIIVETYGEPGSDELKIAYDVCRQLGYQFRERSIDLNYSKVGKIGIWRSEFAIIPFEHPQLSFHSEIKKNADYLISGLPGFDVLNGGHIKLGKIIGGIFNSNYKYWFNFYSRPFNELKELFNKDFISDYFPDLVGSFIKSFDSINVSNNLDKWDIFNITQRQPNYSNISDMVEADLFETLHPFCDTDLLDTFLKVPVRMRMFQQLSKEMIYKYFESVRYIPYDNRGLIKHKYSATSEILASIKNKIIRNPSNSVFWNRKNAIKNDINNIRLSLLRISDYEELGKILNLPLISRMIKSDSFLIEKYVLVEQILSILFAFEVFINPDSFEIPSEVVNNYREF